MTVQIEHQARDMVREMVLASENYSPLDSIALDNWLFVTQDLFVGCVDGTPVCAWGLVPPTLMSDRAYLWSIVLETAKDHEFVLVRHSQIQIKKMLELYQTINGHCEVGEERSIRWLKWLGAEFGVPQGRLVPFTIRRRDG